MKALASFLTPFLFFYSSISLAAEISSFTDLEEEFKNASTINIVLDFKLCKLITDRTKIDERLLLGESTLISFSSIGANITDDKNGSKTMTTSHEETSLETNGDSVIASVLKKTLMINSDSVVKFVLRTDQSKTPVVYSCDWNSLGFGI